MSHFLHSHEGGHFPIHIAVFGLVFDTGKNRPHKLFSPECMINELSPYPLIAISGMELHVAD